MWVFFFSHSRILLVSLSGIASSLFNPFGKDSTLLCELHLTWGSFWDGECNIYLHLNKYLCSFKWGKFSYCKRSSSRKHSCYTHGISVLVFLFCMGFYVLHILIIHVVSSSVTWLFLSQPWSSERKQMKHAGVLVLYNVTDCSCLECCL